jgi:selenide,water dikinase
MAISNKLAVECLIQHNAKACTDVTGFGLAGHLAEMLSEDNVSVELWLDDIPAMDGALESLQAGTLSSLHQDNKLASEIISAHVTSMINPRYELLFDPQTAGGLLVGIPKANTKKCLRQLRKNGYMLATEIGQVTLTGGEQPCIILK